VRELRKQIEVWLITAVVDEYGDGNITSEKLYDMWADLRTLKGRDITELGLDNKSLNIMVTVRKPDVFDFNAKKHFIKYKSEEYTIKSFPTNTNFDNRFIQFIAVKNG